MTGQTRTFDNRESDCYLYNGDPRIDYASQKLLPEDTAEDHP